MKRLVVSLVVLLTVAAAHAQMTMTPWSPIFKGVELATGTNIPSAQFPRLQVAKAMRIDLTDPDVQLFTDPKCTNCSPGYETRALTTSGFLQRYQLQGAVNCSFFLECCSVPADTQVRVNGLLISQGTIVSPTWTPADGLDPKDRQTHYSVLLFNTNNQAAFIATNWPSTNLDGIFTAISGSRPLLTNGLIALFTANTRYDDIDPRTAIGLSQDGRYLIMMTIDGRQPGYSEGANDFETATWLLNFGAWDALNVDGGGSATLVMEDDGCKAKSKQVNVPIHGGIRGNERVVGGHLGFYAKPIPNFVSDVKVESGSSTATITWSTPGPASSQVEYGFTKFYDKNTPLDTTPVTDHSVTLTGLKPGTNYFYRAISRVDGNEYSFVSCFQTTNFGGGMIFDLNQVWKYSVANLDGIAWQAPGFDDTNWPSGPGLLLYDASQNGFIPAQNTTLPIDLSTGYPYITYYLRTHFEFSNNPAGVTLILSNYLDDGAIFYLNGREVHRAYMPAFPAVVTNSSPSSSYPCASGDATCFFLVNIADSLITNLVRGDNVLAVEVHNYRGTSGRFSPDIAFGSALSYLLPPPEPDFIASVGVDPGETRATVTWTTRSNSTSRVEYGLTSALGSSTPLDSALVTNHVVSLTGLELLTRYYYRVISTVGTKEYSVGGTFTTVPYYEALFPVTQPWKYTTANLDGVNWTARDYDDSGWTGPGQALLCIESNPDVYPKNTYLPSAGQYPYRTYYFRTRFVLTNEPVDFTLLFSNYLDDGAVFYLNGREVQRVRMAPAPQVIYNADFATGLPVTDDAIYADVFRMSGDFMTNMVIGTNVLAVEVHNRSATSGDIVFGSEVGFVRIGVAEARLAVSRSENAVCISWPGQGFILQQASQLGSPATWSDVPGPVKASPYCRTNITSTIYYRLRN